MFESTCNTHLSNTIVSNQPFQAQWCQMVTLQSVQGLTGVTNPFNFLTFEHCGASAGLSARVPECQKIKNGGLDQYVPERFGRLTFAVISKSV